MGPHCASEKSETNGPDVDVELFTPPDAKVGSLPFTREPIVCRDLTSLCQASGTKFQGIVGLDFLKKWIITIDFDNRHLDFLVPGTARDTGWGECMPFVYGEPGYMFVLATVGKNVPVSMIVDTGFAGTVAFEDSLYSRLVATRDLQITGNEHAVTLSGQRGSRVGRLSQFSVGPFRHENLRLSTGKQNILGLDYLDRYRVTIDFPNQRFYLLKGKHFASRDFGQTCGIGILFKPAGIEVESVDERGPACSSGVRVKDIIIELCDKPVAKLKPSEIDDLLTTEGKPVGMIIQRGEKRIKITYTPKEYD